MDDELLLYYLEELSALREAGGHFREKYPGVADQLRMTADACEDPHVERLLEGFAFLAARVRSKLDDEFPQITDALLSVLYPHLQRPLPSASIARLGRRAGPAKVPPPGGDRIEAQVPLRVIHPDYRDGRFRTVYPVVLWPIAVVDARLYTERVPVADTRADERALLTLKLRCESPGGFGKLLQLESLRFHLAGEDRIAFVLHELLGSAVTRVELQSVTPTGEKPKRELPPSVIRLVGYEADEGLFPYPERSPRGYRLIQEFFHFWRKFFFFDLGGLDVLSSFGASAEFEVRIFLDRAPRERLTVSAENFLLGCTPVVNLFKAAAVPIRLTRTRSEYPVVPDIPMRQHAEVYSIDRVEGSRYTLEEVEPYEPLHSVRASDTRKNSGPGPFWHAQRRPSPLKDDHGTEVFVSFVSSRIDLDQPADDVISLSLTCTNRDRVAGMPIGLPGGDLEPESPVPSGAIWLLKEPCETVRPPLGRNAAWPLISNLGLNYLSLLDTADEPGLGADGRRGTGSGRDALIAMLETYDFGHSILTPQLSGIVSIASRRVTGFTPRRSIVGGVEITLTFDEGRFLGTSPFLLASILERFFGLYVSINSFTQLIARRSRGDVIKKWTPRIGEKSLL
ncbi:MAG: type VI secretion system baseplate subunit TssF [Isosphaeraceae bacterium]